MTTSPMGAMTQHTGVFERRYTNDHITQPPQCYLYVCCAAGDKRVHLLTYLISADSEDRRRFHLRPTQTSGVRLTDPTGRRPCGNDVTPVVLVDLW